MSASVRAGQGRGALPDHVQLRLGVLRGLSEFFARQRREDGAILCPRHRVEHTGKTVYAALIDLYNWRYTREELYLDRMRRAVLRTVDNFGADPESGAPIFLPGRVDPANASTSSIDGGACADVLSTVLLEEPDLLTGSQRERTLDALTQHVDGYLRHAARDKPIPAQRLWAGTGTARAAVLLDRSDWRADALAGCAKALAELSPDGLAPYIPADTDHCTHPGLADISGFYHSRTPGFILDIHRVLEAPLDDAARAALGRSLDLLIALRDGFGHKVIHDEAKAWYWSSDYEVASHPFDAAALQAGAEMLGRPDDLAEAGRVVEEWIAHLDPLDGGARSHHGRGVNFQCPIFWSGHAAWIARILDRVPVRAPGRPERDIDLPHTGLLHVERPRYTAVLRGARRAHSNLFGCDAGGGCLQSLVVQAGGKRGPEQRVPPERFRLHREGSFAVAARGRPGRLSRWTSLLAAEKADLRFRAFLARVEFRAGRPIAAIADLVRHVGLRPWREAGAWDVAHWDLATTHEYDGEEVIFTGAVADRRGERLAGSRTVRRYRFEPDGVALRDVLELDAHRADGARVQYRLPHALAEVELEVQGGTLGSRARTVKARATGGAFRLVVRGRWTA